MDKQIEEVKSLSCHTSGVFSVVVIDDKTLASVGLDKQLVTWDLAEGKVLTKCAFEQELSCVEKLDENRLLVGDNTGKTFLFDVKQNKVVDTFTEEELAARVNKILKLSDTVFVAGYNEDNLRVWNITDKTSKTFADISTNYTSGIAKLGQNKIAVTTNCSVFILDWTTLTVDKTYGWDSETLNVNLDNMDNNDCYSLQVLPDNNLVLGFDCGLVLGLNSTTLEVVFKQIISADQQLNDVVLDGDNLYYATAKGDVICFNYVLKQKINEKKVHSEGIKRMIKLNDKQVVTASLDSSLKVLNF